MYKLCMNQSLHLYINETNNNNQDYNYVQVINFSTQKLLYLPYRISKWYCNMFFSKWKQDAFGFYA